MNSPNSIFRKSHAFWLLALLLTTSNPASAAAKAAVLGGATAATASAAVDVAKLAVQASGVIVAKFNGEAWTWVSARGETAADTTAWPPGDEFIAEAEKDSSGAWGTAHAYGFADKRGGEPFVTATSTGWSSAKSLAGVGDKYKSDGSSWWAVVFGKIVDIVLDPEPIPLGPVANGSIPSSFQYNIGLTDPWGQKFSLLSVGADMVFDPVIRDWTLDIHDSSNTLSLGDFSRTVDSGGAVTYTLNSPVEFEIPFFIPSTWSAGTTFVLDTTGEVAVQSVGPVPEPETYAMFLAGLGLMGIVARRRKVQQV